MRCETPNPCVTNAGTSGLRCWVGIGQGFFWGDFYIFPQCHISVVTELLPLGRKKVVVNIDEILLELTARNDSWRHAIYELAEINDKEPDFVEELMNQGYSDCLRDIAKALGRG